MRNAIIASAVLLLAPSAAQAQAATSVAYQPSPVAARLEGEAVRFQAAIGGIIGGLAVAVHTISDNERDPVNWGVAVAAPIVGGLIGAGVGWLLR